MTAILRIFNGIFSLPNNALQSGHQALLRHNRVRMQRRAYDSFAAFTSRKDHLEENFKNSESNRKPAVLNLVSFLRNSLRKQSNSISLHRQKPERNQRFRLQVDNQCIIMRNNQKPR